MAQPPAPRWATFDCYGTLVDWRSGIADVLVRLVPGAEPAHLLARYHEIEPAVQAGGYRPYREVLRLTAERIAAEQGRSLGEGEGEALARSLPAWPVFADVRPALAEARRRGWRLAILSNTDRDLIALTLRSIDVPFEHVVVAEDVRSYKPAHAHWQRFRTDTGVGERHVHVAQSQFHDIAPARELGIASVWVNREGEAAAVAPTRELPGMEGLADVLDELLPT